MKRHFFAVVLAICCMFASVAAQENGEGRFWVPADIHWQHPRGAPSGEAVAPVVVLYFQQNGLFTRDECWVIRSGKAITISNGDPHNEWIGRWDPIADGMHVSYRLVRRTVERMGEILPGTMTVEDVELPKSGLKVGNRVFRSVVPTNAAEYAARYSALANPNVGRN